MLLLDNGRSVFLLVELTGLLFYGLLSSVFFEAVDTLNQWRVWLFLGCLGPLVYQYFGPSGNYYAKYRIPVGICYIGFLTVYGNFIRQWNNDRVEWGTGEEFASSVRQFVGIVGTFSLVFFGILLGVLMTALQRYPSSIHRPVVLIFGAIVMDWLVFYLAVGDEGPFKSLYRNQLVFPSLAILFVLILPNPNPAWSFWPLFVAERLMVPLFWSRKVEIDGEFGVTSIAGALALKVTLLAAAFSNEKYDVVSAKDSTDSKTHIA